jgi:hypothetical protein
VRFGANYQHFHTAGLDPDRLRRYRLARYLSLVAGPPRLLDGDFPGMADIAAGTSTAHRPNCRDPVLRRFGWQHDI